MTYKLKSLDLTSSHWPASATFLHDGAKVAKGDKLPHKPGKKAELDAQVASNDYFTMLATRLDQVSQSLKANHHSDYLILEDTICDLLYLHQNYCINKKP